MPVNVGWLREAADRGTAAEERARALFGSEGPSAGRCKLTNPGLKVKAHPV